MPRVMPEPTARSAARAVPTASLRRASRVDASAKPGTVPSIASTVAQLSVQLTTQLAAGKTALEPQQVVIERQRASIRLHQPHLHAQIRRQRAFVPGILGHLLAGQRLELLGHRPQQRPIGGRQPLRDPRGGVGHRHEGAAQLFRQAAQQRRDALFEQPRHQPLQALRRDLIDQQPGQHQGDAIGLMTGLEAILQGQFGGTDL